MWKPGGPINLGSMNPAPRWRHALYLAISAVGAVALIRDTAYNGHDCAVFWRAGRSLLAGEPLYSMTRDGPMVFKYPPWIAPAFVPLALVPLAAAKWVWGALELLSLALVIAWASRRARIRSDVLAGVTLAFWGLWAVHALDGQVVLPMLALALWGWEAGEVLGVAWVLSAKIFSLVALPGLRPRPPAREGGQEPRGPGMPRLARRAAAGVLLFAALSAPALIAEPGWSPARLIAEWAEAASSGYREFGPEHVFGRLNQGLPGLALRLAPPGWMGVRGADLALALAFSAGLGFAWFRMKPREARAAWAGWLALVPVVHPLPWWHLFIFAYPAAALSAERALFAPGAPRGRRVASGAGIFLLTMATAKFLGPLGAWVELASVKSWGALLCLWSLREKRAVDKFHI